MQKNKSQAGFSLVETIIALAIFGVVIASLANPLATSFAANRSSNTAIGESSEAQKMLETIRTQWSVGSDDSSLSTAQNRFDNNCVSGAVVGTVAITAVEINGTVTDTTLLPLSSGAGCDGATVFSGSTKDMKRVRITVGKASYILDIARPYKGGGR